MLEVDVFAYGHVRRGWRRGSTFFLLDCTHPQQNMILDIDKVTHWRARDSMVVIETHPSYWSEMPYSYPAHMADFSIFTGIGGSIASGIFGGLF